MKQINRSAFQPPAVYVIHENSEWVRPLAAAFGELGIPFREVFVDSMYFDLDAAPPPGVFYNRMSASSHTREHRHAAEMTAAYLAWLESHDRRVVNSSKALALEISKAAQYSALTRAGIATPHTIVTLGWNEALKAARRFGKPFIAKHNRGGKGLGVAYFADAASLEEAMAGRTYPAPIDGILLIQEYVRAPQPFIVRLEFIGGRFYYAVRVDTSNGFQLCPADACSPCGVDAGPRFEIIPGFTHPLIERCERFLATNGIEVAGVEFIEDARGDAYVYDVNTNTNYNPEAESRAGLFGMRRLAAFLGEELETLAGEVRASA